MISFYENPFKVIRFFVTLVKFWDIFILDINISGALRFKKGFSLKHKIYVYLLLILFWFSLNSQ